MQINVEKRALKILLGVTGSISAYKTFDLTRQLCKEGHEVKVILTQGALKFVRPEVFGYLGAKDTYLDQDDFNFKNVLHIDLARWADIYIIAPLSANSLSRMARGEASDLLTSVFLAFNPEKNILIFPAMNTQMLHHPFTQENFDSIRKLQKIKNIFISPTDSGILLCQEIGEGKLPSVDEISHLAQTLTCPLTGKKEKKHVLISTGATLSPLDPVRYLTNSSSGITGHYFAKVALSLGHRVTVIAGSLSTDKLNLFLKHPNYSLQRVTTVNEMKEAVLGSIEKSDIYISSAAISDIEFDIQGDKLKKENLGNELKIKKACDILKTVLEIKSQKKLTSLKTVGFAAETILDLSVLRKKMISKPVDLLVGTKVHNGMVEGQKEQGFNQDFAFYRFFSNDEIILEGEFSKLEMATWVLKMFGIL